MYSHMYSTLLSTGCSSSMQRAASRPWRPPPLAGWLPAWLAALLLLEAARRPRPRPRSRCSCGYGDHCQVLEQTQRGFCPEQGRPSSRQLGSGTIVGAAAEYWLLPPSQLFTFQPATSHRQ